MLSSLRILHAPSADNPTNLPVLVLSIDAKRFIFNAPEGLTRVLIQRGSRGAVKGLQGVFVPRVGSEECGGLPGLLMSLADQEKDRLSLYGPPILSQYLATARAYTRRNGFKLDVVESRLHRAQDDASMKESMTADFILYQDKDVTVQSVPLFPSSFALAEFDRQRQIKKQKTGKKKEKSILDAYSPAQRVKQCLSLMFNGCDTESSTHVDQVDSKDEPSRKREHEEIRKAWQTVGSSFNRLSPPPLPPVDMTDASCGQAPALLYIVQGASVRGKFDARAAKSLGVPEGKTYSILSSGQDIKVTRPKEWSSWDDDKKQRWLAFSRVRKRPVSAAPSPEFDDNLALEEVTITSSDVLAPSRPGTAFAQVYLPSIDYLDNFLSAETQCYLKAAEQLHVLVHAVHPSVMREPRYQRFIASHKNTHHFIAARPFVPDRIGYPSAALTTLRLSYLDAELFRVPDYSLSSSESFAIDGEMVEGTIQPCPQDIEISLHPRKAPFEVKDDTPDFDFKLHSSDAKNLASFRASHVYDEQRSKVGVERWTRFLELASHLQEEESKRNSLNMDTNDDSSDIRITTLGTGSALPSKYRNVSATLLHLPNEAGYILLDCGEGTYGQLCRRFGKDVDNVLRDLRCIFISHIHGDHHMGMARILLERRKLHVKDRPLYVLATMFVRNYLLEVSDIESLDICTPEKAMEAESGVIFLDNGPLDYKGRSEGTQAVNESPERWTQAEEINVLAHLDNLERSVLPNVRVQTAEVDHRTSHCFAIVLRGQGWSVAYSGDTRPCRNLADACKDVDILIHEATFEDGEEDQASKKGHSTVGQAIGIGRSAGVRRILLTHFSQRYPKMPRIADAFVAEEGIMKGVESIEPAVSIAFDLMTVRPSDFGKTERYREAMQVLFDEGGDDEGGVGGNDIGGRGSSTGRKASEGANGAFGSSVRSGKMRRLGGDVPKDDALKTKAAQFSASNEPMESSRVTFQQRKSVKEQDFSYIVTHIQAVAQSSSRGTEAFTKGTPTRLAFSESLGRVTEDLYGLVGASFHRDILLYDVVQTAGRKPFVQAVVKVATAYAQHLISAISSGVTLKVDRCSYVTKFVGTLNAHQLSNIRTLHASDPTNVTSSVAVAPGRAWMEQNVVTKRL